MDADARTRDLRDAAGALRPSVHTVVVTGDQLHEAQQQVRAADGQHGLRRPPGQAAAVVPLARRLLVPRHLEHESIHWVTPASRSAVHLSFGAELRSTRAPAPSSISEQACREKVAATSRGPIAAASPYMQVRSENRWPTAAAASCSLRARRRRSTHPSRVSHSTSGQIDETRRRNSARVQPTADRDGRPSPSFSSSHALARPRAGFCVHRASLLGYRISALLLRHRFQALEFRFRSQFLACGQIWVQPALL